MREVPINLLLVIMDVARLSSVCLCSLQHTRQIQQIRRQYLQIFVTRLAFGLETIERSVLRKNWCPFDTVVVLWNPTLESVDSWVKVADPNFYADPAAQRWQTPISLWKMFREPDLPTP